MKDAIGLPTYLPESLRVVLLAILVLLSGAVLFWSILWLVGTLGGGKKRDDSPVDFSPNDGSNLDSDGD